MTPKKDEKPEKVEEKKAPQYAGLNIHQRLHAVMKEIDYVQKEDKKVNNQYTFVSHDAVTAKCRKSFVAWGVLTIPTVNAHSSEWCTRKKKVYIDKKEAFIDEPILRTTLTVEVKFVNIDTPEQAICTTAIGYGLDDQDKGVGKAYSYAVKYAYLKALGLETGDDPERDTHQEVTPEKAIGGSIRGQIDPEQEAQFYAQALSSIEGAVDWDSLKKVWSNQWKSRATYKPDHWVDIEQKYQERKKEFPEATLNGASH